MSYVYAIRHHIDDVWLGADDLSTTAPDNREMCLFADVEKRHRAIFRERGVAHTVCKGMCGRRYKGVFVVVRIPDRD